MTSAYGRHAGQGYRQRIVVRVGSQDGNKKNLFCGITCWGIENRLNQCRRPVYHI